MLLPSFLFSTRNTNVHLYTYAAVYLIYTYTQSTLAVFFFFFSPSLLFTSIDAALPLLSSLSFLFFLRRFRPMNACWSQAKFGPNNFYLEKEEEEEGQRSWGSTKLTRLCV
jgi:hypothetical protein